MFFEDLFIIYSIDSTPNYVLCNYADKCVKLFQIHIEIILAFCLCHVVSRDFFFLIHAFLFQTIS